MNKIKPCDFLILRVSAGYIPDWTKRWDWNFVHTECVALYCSDTNKDNLDPNTTYT